MNLLKRRGATPHHQVRCIRPCFHLCVVTFASSVSPGALQLNSVSKHLLWICNATCARGCALLLPCPAHLLACYFEFDLVVVLSYSSLGLAAPFAARRWSVSTNTNKCGALFPDVISVLCRGVGAILWKVVLALAACGSRNTSRSAVIRVEIFSTLKL